MWALGTDLGSSTVAAISFDHWATPPTTSTCSLSHCVGCPSQCLDIQIFFNFPTCLVYLDCLWYYSQEIMAKSSVVNLHPIFSSKFFVVLNPRSILSCGAGSTIHMTFPASGERLSPFTGLRMHKKIMFVCFWTFYASPSTYIFIFTSVHTTFFFLRFFFHNQLFWQFRILQDIEFRLHFSFRLYLHVCGSIHCVRMPVVDRRQQIPANWSYW